MYLEKINSPKDMKTMSLEDLTLLSNEIREALLTKLSHHGGHIGPNLGVVELTIALHYVFNSPVDKLVFDVSHQSYIHKMLTGRNSAFLEPEKYDDVSGYTNPHESEHDFFNVGHTSTSVSLACGLAKARDLKGDKENVIAIIGDGSLSGGEAFEGLNNAAETGTNMIIVVNDNDQSISENHGGMYKNLADLRASNGTAECNFFKSMGLDYKYVKDGHSIAELIEVFQSVKDTDRPVVIHVPTVKGKGYKLAEEHRERYHAGPPFDLETGEYVFAGSPESYESTTADYLFDLMKKDPTVSVITAGTPTGFGLTQEKREAAGKQYIDVGIAEEHAVALASGMAKNGAKPVFTVFSTFLQRTYDQLSQDLCVNNNPAVILVYGASVSGMFNDVTHLGFFDIPMLTSIPNLVYLAPTCKEEHFAMLDWAIHQTEHPVAIRVPAIEFIESGIKDTTDYSIINKYQVTKKGSKVAILALGSYYPLGVKITSTLAKENGVEATLINPKFITGVDEKLLESLKEDHVLVITLEDGVLEGGFGEKIARYYGPSAMKVKNYGIKKGFPDRYNAEELLKQNGVSHEQITNDVINLLNI
jgi:1-deoxy-D-xylulose-5-phosphate synthase